MVHYISTQRRPEVGIRQGQAVRRLTGRVYCSTSDAQANALIDLISEAGLACWEVPDIGTTHDDGCHYPTFSAHMGVVDLNDLA